MSTPTPEEAAARKAVVAERLRRMTPIWQGKGMNLYLSTDGYYILTTGDDIIGVTPDGELVDMAGYAVVEADYNHVMAALRAIYHLDERHWQMKRRLERRYGTRRNW